MRSSPASGFSRPDIMRNSVVLPAPFGPMMPTMPPAGRLKFRLSMSRRSPYDLRRFFASITTIAQALARRDVDLVGLVALLEFARGELFVTRHARLVLGAAAFRARAHPLEFRRELLAQAFVGSLFRGESRALLLEPGGVVALVGNAVAAIQLEDPLGDVVEEVAIVRDRDDGGWIGLEVLLEPRDRLGIEMVGGLVQQQHVGRRQQQAAQRDAAFLATRKLVDDGFPGRQAQRVGGDLELALEFPAADRVDGVLQFGLFLEELVHLLVVHRLGELVADLVEARDLRERAAQTFHHDAAHVLVRIELGFLRQIADLDAGLRARLAFVSWCRCRP